MGEKTQNEVATKFSVNWQGASQGLTNLGTVADRLGGRIMRLTQMFTPLGAAMGAITSGALVRSLTQINSRFEQTSQVIGGTLAALGFAGGEDPTEQFRNGLGLAAETMRAIQVSAAALPGEAQDYITVFQQALPNVSQSIEGSLADMTSFTNQITAIGRSFGIDAGQIGMDTMRMLQAGRGGAGMDVRTFMQLLPFMKSLEGHANLTADAFNRMTQPERALLLQQTMGRMGPMLEAAGGTFDAMWGAIQSTGEELLRIGGQPIFEGVKSGLESVNALLMDAEGNFTELGQNVVRIGQNIGTFIVDAIRTATEWVQTLYGWFERLGNSAIFRRLDEMASTLASAGQSLMRGGAGGAAGLAGGAATAGALGAGAAAGPMGLVVVALGAGLANFLTRTEEVTEVVGTMGSIIERVSHLIGPMLNTLMTFSDLLGDLVAGVLPGMLSGMDTIIGPLTFLYIWFSNIANLLMEELRPAMSELWIALGGLWEAVANVIGPLLAIFGPVLMGIIEILVAGLAPAFNLLIEWITGMINALVSFVNWVGRLLGGAGAGVISAAQRQSALAPGAQGEAAEQRGFLSGLMDRLRQSSEAASEQASAVEQAAGGRGPAARAPGARGGARTQQDFRYSRFTIEQSFAEGFDPDRIAVAFASDVGRLGEQRLESGFAPLFGIR